MQESETATEAALQAEIADRKRAEEVSRGQTAVLTRTLAALASAPALDAFLGLVLQSIAEQLGTQSAALWLTGADGLTSLHIDYDQGVLRPADQTEHPGPLHSTSKAFILATHARSAPGGAYLVDDVYAEPALAPIWDYFRKRRIQNLLLVALRMGETAIGQITIRGMQRRPYRAEEIELALALAHQATLAIQLTRLAERDRQPLERQRDELERRVAARTAELTTANDQLHEQIIQRQQTEQIWRGYIGALTRTLDRLSAEPASDTFLSQVLVTIAEQLRVIRVALWLYDVESDVLTFSKAYHNGQITDELPPAPPFIASGVRYQQMPIFQELIRTRQPVLVRDVSNDPLMPVPHSQWLQALGFSSLLAVPLLLGERLLGWLTVPSTERRQYEPQELELVRALAQQVTLAIQLNRLAEQGRKAAIEEERNRMVREIHDTLAQGFAGIVLSLEAAEAAMDRGLPQAKEAIARARRLARDSLGGAAVGLALRPQALDGGGLATALPKLIETLNPSPGVKIDFTVQGPVAPLRAESETNLLRVAQEALNNALKHARASLLRVGLRYESDRLELSIEDNGVGFDPGFSSKVDPSGLRSSDEHGKSGFGFISMQERAQAIGGTLSILSRPGGGTRVWLTLRYDGARHNAASWDSGVLAEDHS